MPDEPVLLGTRRTPSEQNALDEYLLGFISRDELIRRLDQLKNAPRSIGDRPGRDF